MNIFSAIFVLCLAQYVVCVTRKIENEYGLFVPRIETREESRRNQDYTIVDRDYVPSLTPIPVQTVPLIDIPFNTLSDHFFEKDVPIQLLIRPTFIDESNIFNIRLSQFPNPNYHPNGEPQVKQFYLVQNIPQGQQKDTDDKAYYVAQHKFIDIPITPAPGDPKYVFTEGFSGCSFVVDRMANSYRVYHVSGGRENAQYNDLPEHGYGMAAIMQYHHYGTYTIGDDPQQRYENTFGVAFMRFDETNQKWVICYQKIDYRPGESFQIDGRHLTQSVVSDEIGIKFKGLATTPGKGLLSVKKETIPVERDRLPIDPVVRPVESINLRNCLARPTVGDLPGVHRTKRSIFKRCAFDADDVEHFSKKKVEPGQLQSPDDVDIDAEKFFNYIKHNGNREANEQLLHIFKSNKQIQLYAETKPMLGWVIMDHGFDQYQQKQRLNDLGSDLLTNDKIRQPNVHGLKSHLIATYGHIQLINGIRDVYFMCKEGYDAVNCGVGVAATTVSIISIPIEGALVKFAPKITTIIGRAISTGVSHIVPTNSKFIVRYAAHYIVPKNIVKIGSGAIAVVGLAFDIYYAVDAVKGLVDCANRKGTESSCTDKEWRDSVAAVAFSGASTVSGIAVLAFSANPVVGVAIATALMVGQGIYNGISNVIEYKEKYHTTASENWDIFWNSFFQNSLGDNIEELVMRQNRINSTAQNMWKFLNCTPQNVYASGVGLGHLYSSLADHAKIELNVENASLRNELTRTIPDPIPDATILCLPHYTHEAFENGVYGYSPDAVYYCENAMVIADKRRINSDTIVFLLDKVDSGRIVGSNKYKNIFYIYNGTAEIFGGNDTVNNFRLHRLLFYGKLVGGSNSTNIVDVSQMTNFNGKIQATFQQKSCVGGNLTLDLNNWKALNDRIKSQNHYVFIGRSKMMDEISCSTACDKPELVINSGGGIDRDNMDEIKSCQRIILSPFTTITGQTKNCIIHVEVPKAYENNTVLYSKIDNMRGQYPVNVIFSRFELIANDVQFTHVPQNNTVFIEIRMDNGNVFVVEIPHYFKDDGSSVCNLFDKSGHNIVPRMGPKSMKGSAAKTEIEDFEAHIGCTSNCKQIVEEQYAAKKDFTKRILSVIKNTANNNTFILGSRFNDIIYMNEAISLARGHDGSDIYIPQKGSAKIYRIDNMADDQGIDAVLLSAVPKEYQIDKCDLMVNTGNGTIILLENYFRSSQHRHVAFMNQFNEAFIPNLLNMKLLTANDSDCSHATTILGRDGHLARFIHATPKQNTFVLTNKIERESIVIDAIANELNVYKDFDDLLLIRNGTDTQSMIIKFQDFYLHRTKWAYINVLLYDKGQFTEWSVDDGIQVQDLKAKLADDYQTFFEEYDADFATKLQTINKANINNRIGLLKIKNISPNRIEVLHRDNQRDDLILRDADTKNEVHIKNWANTSQRISFFELDLDDFEPITIRNLHRFSTQDAGKMQELFQRASAQYELRHERTPTAVIGVKCFISIDSLQRNENAHHCADFRTLNEQISFMEQYCSKERLIEFRESVTVKQVMSAMNSLIIDAALNGYSEPSEQLDCTNKYLRYDDDSTDTADFKVNLANTLYYLAVKEGDLNTIKKLFSNYTNWERDNDDMQPLHWAAKFGQTKVAELIMNEGAGKNSELVYSKDKRGRVPLHYSMENRHNEISRYLSKFMDDFSIRDNNGITLDDLRHSMDTTTDQIILDANLLRASQSGDLCTVKSLISKGINPNATDTVGRNAIHYAAIEGHLDIIEYLSQFNIDISKRNTDNLTPLDYVFRKIKKNNKKFDYNALLNVGYYLVDHMPNSDTDRQQLNTRKAELERDGLLRAPQPTKPKVCV